MGIILVSTIAELAAKSTELLLRKTAKNPGTLGLIPTMGALHEGHATLARASVAENAVSVASVFVNPLQFGDAADLERYPRTTEADLALLDQAGVDLMFAPSVEEMYPFGEPAIRVTAGPLGDLYEGASRPGHFDGALTVVAKLLHVGLPLQGLAASSVRPSYRAYFGQKDAQQLALVKRMVADLNFPVEIVGVPLVRDADGLALSSRNRFLSPEQKASALVLSQAMKLLAGQAAAGEPLDIEAARALVRGTTGVELDYLEVVDPVTLDIVAAANKPLNKPLNKPWNKPLSRPALALVAAQVGPVRLIDNTPLG